jgi:hypothetical protein
MLRSAAMPPASFDAATVLGDLKAFLARCREPELLLVKAWLQAELARGAPLGLRLVRTPSSYEPGAWSGSFVELAGHLRKDLHQLRPAELIVLHGWVGQRLARLGG